MKSPLVLLTLLLALSVHAAEPELRIQRDIPYGSDGDERQKLDVYSPPQGKGLPVIVWIHGGGWQSGDKGGMHLKPQAFCQKGFVFVAVNYRLLPKVKMGDIIRDVAKSVGHVHEHAAAWGGDPKRIFIMGHSAGAQLAAILCTDEKYLKAEGLSFAIVKGCVPVDGDTYDVPAIIASATAKRKAKGQPEPTFGHREKFGTPEQHREYSAVTHVAPDRGIPPFLLLYVLDDPNTMAQAERLGELLMEAKVPTITFGARDTNHSNINALLGTDGDPSTQAVYDFLETCLEAKRKGVKP